MTELLDAFISYGRADSKAFAIKLQSQLAEHGFQVWFDFNDIPLGVDFQNQIDDGIEKASHFLFLISPHSVNSPYCLKEVELALRLKKRIIPLLHVEAITQETWQQRNPNGTPQQWEEYQKSGRHSSFPNMHPTIGKINWVYFREGIDDFDKSLADLVNLLRTHGDYVTRHTQFLIQALEWERHQKQTHYLLTGEEKQHAQDWLKIHFKNEQPPCLPSSLHCEYITESIKNGNNGMTQVFLSYPTQERETMEKIRSSLRRESITVWTNSTDIQTGEAFEDAIDRGIEEADNFVYLLSPDSIDSTYCQKELELAVSLNKRVIPILVRETDPQRVPSLLQSLQYIDLTDNVKEEDYLLDESELLRILRQDAAYYDRHKVLLTKALKWKRQNENPSIALRGHNLRSAEAWLKVARTRTTNPPTALHEEFITHSLQQPPLESLDVFIAYSRADSDFARQLNDRLQIQGKMTWFDRESISSDGDFQQEIYRGIKACDNFLFVLSPRSIDSPECIDEVEYAASLNKRFVTLLHRSVNPTDLHPELAKVQSIDFHQHNRDFNAGFNQLVRTLDTDREHVHSHTKWLQRALEWEQKEKNRDLLLRGSEFSFAQNWLGQTEQQQKKPAATPLQTEFIEASQKAIADAEAKEKRRQAELLRLQEERTKEAEARLAEQEKHAKRQRFFLAAVSAALVAAVGVSIVAVSQWRRAERQQQRAVTVTEGQVNALGRFSGLLNQSDRTFDGLLEGLRARGQLKNLTTVNPALKAQIGAALQSALYAEGFREDNRLIRHRDRVLGIVFSPDGETIASASFDKTVKLWNREGKLLQTLKGHQEGVYSVAFSPDGETIASTSADRTIKLWNREGKLLQTLEGHQKQVGSVAFSPDGETIASASYDNTIKLWNREGELLQTLEGHQDGVPGVDFSPNGETIATASLDNTVKLWNRNGALLQTLTGHQDGVYDITFSRDGQTIATASLDNTVKLWNRNGALLQTLTGHQEGVHSVAFSPDGETIATASLDSTLKLWNREGELLQTLAGHREGINRVTFSPDGQTIATASNDTMLKLWKRQEELLWALKDHQEGVNSVAFSPDGETIATASLDKTVKLWNRNGELLQTLEGHQEGVYSVAFSSDGETLATAGDDKTIKLWNREGKLLQTFAGHQKRVYGIAFSPDRQTLATASWDNTVKLWNREGKLLQTLTGHQKEVASVAFSPDGETIATASFDKTVKLWNREGELLQTLTGHEEKVFDIVFSPDGATMASASWDRTVKLWNREGELLQTLEGHQNWVNSVAFSPDGETIASTGWDRTVKLWNREGELRQTLKGHADKVLGVTFSPDGQTLASASSDRTAILWNLPDLTFDKLTRDACDRVGNYLKYNASKGDRNLCQDLEE